MFDMSLFTDKKKQEQIGELAKAVLKTINDTHKLAQDNNEMLKKLTEAKKEA